MFDFQHMTQGQHEALGVLLALTDQEHAAAQTRVTAVTGRQYFTTWTTDRIVDMNGKKTLALLTRPPGPASLSASELLFWTRPHGTMAAKRGWLQENRAESMSSRMVATGRTGHVDVDSQVGLGPEFRLGRLHLSASRLCARRRSQKQQEMDKTSADTLHKSAHRPLLADCSDNPICPKTKLLPEVLLVIIIILPRSNQRPMNVFL